METEKNWYKKTGCLIGIAGAILAGLFIVIMFFWIVGVYNSEARMRNTIVAKQKDNTSEFDSMWKKIDQVAQVTDMQKEALKDIIVSHAKARTGTEENKNLLMKWVQESVPNVDQSTFTKLMNVITSSRDGFAFRQKELLDLSREHNNLLTVFPGSMVLSILGKQPIDVTIVTSTRTENVFKTGKDDDVNLRK